MRLAQAFSTVSILTALGSGCGQDTTAPRRMSQSQTSSGDFNYIAKPPNVALTPSKVVPAAIPFCNSSIGPLICYTPIFLRTAYNFPSGLDGTGQTILIVDAFGSPTITSDLAQFDETFGIPAPPSFQVLCPQGCPTFSPNNAHGEAGWSLETSLDVEYAHAMAPGANIVLVVASTSSGNAINAAEAAVIPQFPGSILSQSFGVPEILVQGNNAQIAQAEQIYVSAQQEGITVLATAGDFGATNGFQTANAQFPASDPLVTAVGGTEGDPYPGGLVRLNGKNVPLGYGGEQVWNEPQLNPPGATGGAPSLLFSTPSYQSGLGLAARTTPDIAYNAAVNGGVLVLDNALGGFFIVGGTSAGSPQWAAIFALADQLKGAPLGFMNPTIYRIGCSGRYGQDFHDITVGNNQLAGTPVGFNAGAGWDDATGWGTPDVANLVQDLVSPPSCAVHP